MLLITAMPFYAKHLQVLLIYPGEFLFFDVVDLKVMTNNDDNEVIDEMKQKDPARIRFRGVKSIGKEVGSAYLYSKLYELGGKK